MKALYNSVASGLWEFILCMWVSGSWDRHALRCWWYGSYIDHIYLLFECFSLNAHQSWPLNQLVSMPTLSVSLKLHQGFLCSLLLDWGDRCKRTDSPLVDEPSAFSHALSSRGCWLLFCWGLSSILNWLFYTCFCPFGHVWRLVLDVPCIWAAVFIHFDSLCFNSSI